MPSRKTTQGSAVPTFQRSLLSVSQVVVADAHRIRVEILELAGVPSSELCGVRVERRGTGTPSPWALGRGNGT